MKIFLLILVLALNFKVSARESAIEAVDKNNLRVCADPSNLPFQMKMEKALKTTLLSCSVKNLTYLSYMSFFLKLLVMSETLLTKKKCDIIIGITAGNDLVLNTVPYMRWSYGMIFLMITE